MHDVHDRQLHADGNINDFDDFMELIHRLWTSVHPDCQFIEEWPTDADPENLQYPAIVYDMGARKHSEDMPQGQKPRVMKSYPDHEQPGYNITEATEWFDCIAEFHVHGNSKREAREWKNKLESFLLGYTGFFKQQGVQEFLFIEEEKPVVSTFYRQELPHRVLRYKVRIQRTQVIRTKRFTEFETKAGVKHPSGMIEELLPTGQRRNEFLDLYDQHSK